MIFDWKTTFDPNCPIGQPVYARKSYMSVFCVLEGLAMGRAFDDELATWPHNGALAAADDERKRRIALED